MLDTVLIRYSLGGGMALLKDYTKYTLHICMYLRIEGHIRL